MLEKQLGEAGIVRLGADSLRKLVSLRAPAARFLTGEEIQEAAAAAAPRIRAIRVEPFDRERLDRAKSGFTTRRISRALMKTLISGGVRPRAGDLVLARVDRLRHHQRIELPTGRKAQLHVGDEIIVAYANRYAPDQFEAHVPTSLGPTNLVASGGVAADAVSHSGAVSSASEITPIGLVGGSRGNPINVADFALRPVPAAGPRPRTLAVLGTSMNSGKTTTNRFLVNGLSRAGLAPGATKVTGTGSGGDFWIMVDAGAHRVLDFTDVGLASTYLVPISTLERTFAELVDHLTAAGCGAILIEVADGLYERETARLIESEVFRSRVDGVIFAAGEAMGAAAGVEHLRRLGLPLVGVSGRLTISPLAVRETAAACGLPVFGAEALLDPATAAAIVGLRPRTPIPELPSPHAAAGHGTNGARREALP